MSQTAFVTGADRGLGSALVAGLLEQGWSVFAGQHRPDWPELGALASRVPNTLHLVPLDVTAIELACVLLRRPLLLLWIMWTC